MCCAFASAIGSTSPSQEGEGAGGVGPLQEARDHRDYARGGTGAGLGGGRQGGLGGPDQGERGIWRYVGTTGIWTHPMRTV